MVKIHPLTGEPLNGKPVNGKVREELLNALASQRQPQSRMSYDAARVGTDLDGHWAFADSNDSDSANDKGVRHTLVRRSRYEEGSNGYYCGIINTHDNMTVGVGPTLRMLTGSRDFNQLVEREWEFYCKQIQLRRKLWCMGHARIQDGEAFAIMVQNDNLIGRVQLDIVLIETEQCQTPILPFPSVGRIDGIHFDEFNNPTLYDILPHHPGAQNQFLITQTPIEVPAAEVLHWFKMARPGAHRGRPDLTPTMTSGAMNRRMREATVASVESAASAAAVAKTQLTPNSEDSDAIAPFREFSIPRRAMLFMPMGWEIDQLRAAHPNAQYAEFHRQQLSEQASPLSQPYNVAAHDSSTYSFASGKLDTLCYRAAIDIERKDCNDLVLDPLFAAWFREWTILAGRRDIPPDHQWDWPAHPVIDDVADATATDTRLKNGTETIREAYSCRGRDYEDELSVQAEDWFGEATDETIQKARTINLLRTVGKDALPYVAQLAGLSPIQTQQPQTQEAGNAPAETAY